MSDIGLLGAKMNIDPSAIINENNLFIEYKGAFAEQFVFQEMMAQKITPYYYSRDDSKGEIDFLLDLGTTTLPIEVKSGENTASTAFNNFIKTWDLKKAVKLSTLPLKENENIDNLPLYLAGTLAKHYKNYDTV